MDVATLAQVYWTDSERFFSFIPPLPTQRGTFVSPHEWVHVALQNLRAYCLIMPNVDQTKQRLFDLLTGLESEAYQKGWNDAVAKIVASANQGRPDAASVETKKISTAKPFTSQYETPIIKMVLQVICDKPGLIGADIIREVAARDSSITPKTAERTGRTSLSRLRKSGKIRKRGTRWYPAQEREKI